MAKTRSIKAIVTKDGGLALDGNPVALWTTKQKPKVTGIGCAAKWTSQNGCTNSFGATSKLGTLLFPGKGGNDSIRRVRITVEELE